MNDVGMENDNTSNNDRSAVSGSSMIPTELR
jgi:hypothetical protein